MNREPNGPRDPKNKKVGNVDRPERIGDIQPDTTPRREGGDDSLENASPTDSRADEKVIVNQERENKVVNIPSQTAVNTSEQAGSDEEAI
ncbi:MAG: hypothetical protein ACO1NX_02705 [Chitinophagaceae bacterium]